MYTVVGLLGALALWILVILVAVQIQDLGGLIDKTVKIGGGIAVVVFFVIAVKMWIEERRRDNPNKDRVDEGDYNNRSY